MVLRLFISSIFFLLFTNCKEKTPETVAANTITTVVTEEEPALEIVPVEHASLILSYGDLMIYVDPVGHLDVYDAHKTPDYILITDIHGDHLNVETLKQVAQKSTTLIVPKAVKEKLPPLEIKNIIVLANGDSKAFENLGVEAIPMYNLRKEALQFHEKGRGNGYVLTLGDQRIYISGDTEDIEEMRNLKAIDIAFVCMNLPYTMTVESAADAVLDFKPKTVYPYHYRGTDGMSDIQKFKSIVNAENPNIEVKLENWYQ